MYATVFPLFLRYNFPSFFFFAKHFTNREKLYCRLVRIRIILNYSRLFPFPLDLHKYSFDVRAEWDNNY